MGESNRRFTVSVLENEINKLRVVNYRQYYQLIISVH